MGEHDTRRAGRFPHLDFALKLQHAQKTGGYTTAAELAAADGITVGDRAIRRYLSGVRLPPIEHMAGWEKACGLEPGTLAREHPHFVGDPSPTPTPTPPTPTPTPTPTRRRGRGAMLVVALVLITLAGTGIAVALIDRKPEPAPAAAAFGSLRQGSRVDYPTQGTSGTVTGLNGRHLWLTERRIGGAPEEGVHPLDSPCEVTGTQWRCGRVFLGDRQGDRGRAFELQLLSVDNDADAELRRHGDRDVNAPGAYRAITLPPGTTSLAKVTIRRR